MAKTGEKLNRIDILFFEGINCSTASGLTKKEEFFYLENARANIIGALDKRGGVITLGNTVTATANYGIFYFDNDYNNGLYKISTVSGVTSIYYLNGSSVWTALSSFGTSMMEIGSSTTQFDISNPSGSTFRYTYDGTGTDPVISRKANIGSTIVINAQNFHTNNKGTFTVTGVGTTYFDITNASGVVESNKTIGTGSIKITGNNFSYTSAEGCMFLVNGDSNNLYIYSDGTTVVSSITSTGHLYNSPKARKINYYKDKLYLADFTIGTKRFRNSVAMSSVPSGVISLVDGNHAAPITSVTVTDTKYVHASDSLDVYRGGSKVGVLTVTAKTEYILTATIAFEAGFTSLVSADQLWVANSYTGERIFRWADNPSDGIDVQIYNTFKISGGDNGRIKMMTNVGDVQVFATNNSMSFFNGSSLRNLDLNIGCVSDKGYVKAFGNLYFIHYNGIYVTSGSEVPKLISTKIDRYIRGASKTVLENSCMGATETSIFLALSSVTLYNSDGSTERTLSNVVIERNIQQENWFVHTGIKATEFVLYRSSSDRNTLAMTSSETGLSTLAAFSGQVDAIASENREIQFVATSQPIYLRKSFEKYSYLLEVILEADRGSGIKCFISVDDEPFYEIKGEFIKGSAILKVTSKDENVNEPVRCKKVVISIRDFTNKICRINKVSLVYAPSDENN